MDEYQVRMSAHQDKDGVVINVSLDDAKVTMRYENKESISILVGNLDRVLEYMWNDYLIRKEFNDQLENLEDWINDGD